MKKLVSVLLLVVLLMTTLIPAIAQAEESAVERTTRLLTSYTWYQDGYNYLYLTNSKSIYPNFRWRTSIHLPNSDLVVTGDATGKVYIVDFGSSSGTSCPGEISFSADEKTMLICVVSGDLYGVFKYIRY